MIFVKAIWRKKWVEDWFEYRTVIVKVNTYKGFGKVRYCFTGK